MLWNLQRIIFTCSLNFTQAFLYQMLFNSWKEVVLIGYSSFIPNWKNAIGVGTYGLAANFFDPLETWLLTQSSTILMNLRRNRKRCFIHTDQGDLGNWDSMTSNSQGTGEACCRKHTPPFRVGFLIFKWIPRSLLRGATVWLTFVISNPKYRG